MCKIFVGFVTSVLFRHGIGCEFPKTQGQLVVPFEMFIVFTLSVLQLCVFMHSTRCKDRLM